MVGGCFNWPPPVFKGLKLQTEEAICKAKMGNWRTEWGKCGELGWECEEWDVDAGAGN